MAFKRRQWGAHAETAYDGKTRGREVGPHSFVLPRGLGSCWCKLKEELGSFRSFRSLEHSARAFKPDREPMESLQQSILSQHRATAPSLFPEMAWAAARVKPRALGPTTSAKLCSGKLVAAGREPRSVVLFSVFSISVPHCPRAFTEPCLGSRCSSRCVCFVPARLVEAVASSPPSQGDSAPFFALGFGSEQRPTGVGPVQGFCKALCGILQERQESARRLLEDIVGVARVLESRKMQDKLRPRLRSLVLR